MKPAGPAAPPVAIPPGARVRRARRHTNPEPPPLTPADRARFTVRARLLKALAHPTRLFLLDVLSRGERSVGDLAALAGADISTVSRHLALLRSAGILAGERRGAAVLYHLRTPCALSFFSCAENVLDDVREDEALVRARAARPARAPLRPRASGPARGPTVRRRG